MDAQGQLTLSGLLLLGKSIQRYRPVFTMKCISFVGNSVGTTEFRDKMPDREMEGNLLHQYNAAMSFINRNLKSIQVEQNFNSIARLEIPLDVFVETLANALIHRDYYQNAPIRLFIFDNRIEIHSPGILPDSVTEESIKQGISKPRNQLLFDNAKYLLPYTGIGSGIVRAMKSYDHITFENNYTKEEFIVTVVRQEIPEDSDYDESKSDYDSDYDEQKSNYDGNYDEQKSNYDGNYDEQILTFALIPKNRKEIMDLIGISTQTKNYEHHIVPLLKKGLLAMTLPDKPKSKNQKYVTTERGEALLKKTMN
jgi:predicted HTH transcriptional regulator